MKGGKYIRFVAKISDDLPFWIEKICKNCVISAIKCVVFKKESIHD
jgi:peroxiredoxin